MSEFERNLRRRRVELQFRRILQHLSKYPPWMYVLALGLFSFVSYMLVWPVNEVTQSKLEVSPLSYSDTTESDGLFPSFVGGSEATLHTIQTDRQKAVVNAFKHAWRAYGLYLHGVRTVNILLTMAHIERDAMGKDEYHPKSHRGTDFSTNGGIGYFIVDSLDTMHLMGLRSEYNRARKWIMDELSFDKNGMYITFEITIRVLGGLLSAYFLTSDPLYRDRAIDLGERILPAFNTPSGLPVSYVNLAKSKETQTGMSGALGNIAEVASLQLEFKYLAEVAKNETFWRKAENVMAVVNQALPEDGLAPISIDVYGGKFMDSEIRLGSRGDSYYEYLLKQYLQTERTEPIYKKMYDIAMKSVQEKMVKKTPTKKLTYIAPLTPQRLLKGGKTWSTGNRQEHLVCFLAGSLMLGATTSGALSQKVSVPPLPEELTPQGRRDWQTGVELLETCMRTHETATGLSPEIVTFGMDPDGSDRDWYIQDSKGGTPVYDARYMLRPETVESLFIAFRLTGDPRYRDYAWNIFSAIEKHCRFSEGGYLTVLHVDQTPVQHFDQMETFIMSETLKYLYLIFGDSSVLPLNEVVFNTEAHPLPVFKPSIKPAFT
ncbi:mannosyl-oligosaccharide alpha-1,2-mannosidase [Paramarasmius palmivorus]|uniref:alpha-1,2-Mannosidase n=1 Tax=Paramarasmius palmivorus TaxID=297713 RepID=A0AAW0DD19_9AGAR